jgi:hypothetical protein
MAYQSKYKGKDVEDILDNALLKKKQTFSDAEKKQVKENLGIKDPDLSDYATKEELEEALAGVGSKDDLMAIELSEEGDVVLVYGEESELSDGYIREDGELVLEFNYE